MAEANRTVVELVAARLAESEALLERFLDEPAAVTAELTDEPVDQATLEAIGRRLRERFGVEEGPELPDSELDRVAGGFARYALRLRSWRPVIGPSSGFTTSISHAG